MTTISEILGCASPTNERLEHDRYHTPAWCTEALAKVESVYWPDPVWEVCSGTGSMAEVLSKYVRVIESDLIPVSGRPQIRQLDFRYQHVDPRVHQAATRARHRLQRLVQPGGRHRCGTFRRREYDGRLRCWRPVYRIGRPAVIVGG